MIHDSTLSYTPVKAINKKGNSNMVIFPGESGTSLGKPGLPETQC
jgi:hypothetical protein